MITRTITGNIPDQLGGMAQMYGTGWAGGNDKDVWDRVGWGGMTMYGTGCGGQSDPSKLCGLPLCVAGRTEWPTITGVIYLPF